MDERIDDADYPDSTYHPGFQALLDRAARLIKEGQLPASRDGVGVVQLGGPPPRDNKTGKPLRAGDKPNYFCSVCGRGFNLGSTWQRLVYDGAAKGKEPDLHDLCFMAWDAELDSSA